MTAAVAVNKVAAVGVAAASMTAAAVAAAVALDGAMVVAARRGDAQGRGGVCWPRPAHRGHRPATSSSGTWFAGRRGRGGHPLLRLAPRARARTTGGRVFGGGGSFPAPPHRRGLIRLFGVPSERWRRWSQLAVARRHGTCGPFFYTPRLRSGHGATIECTTTSAYKGCFLAAFRVQMTCSAPSSA